MADPNTGFGNRIEVAVTSPAVTLTFLEKSVTPGGFEGDDEIDTATNASTRFNSREPGDLVTKTDMTASVVYKLSDISDIKSIINIAGTVTRTDKLGNTDVDNGWIKSFVPDELVKGEQPTATLTISYEGEDAAGDDNQVISIAG